MGILDRIREDNDVDAILAAEQALAQQSAADEIATERAMLVARRVNEFADSMGVECLELSPREGARYFLVGDIVLVVRPRGRITKEDLEVTERVAVLWQHTVAAVGVDIIESIHEASPGTLTLLAYASIRKAINSHGMLDFSHESVVQHLYRESS